MPDSSRPSTIVAVTGEQDRHAAVRARAAAMAAGARATVILYDLDAASAFESPLPTNWSSGGAEEQVPDRLSPDDLERAGRANVAQQVRGLRQIGVDAWAWLPKEPGGDALAAYAREQGADLILVPADLERPGPLARLLGNDVDTARAGADIPVVVVGGDDGDAAPVPPRS